MGVLHRQPACGSILLWQHPLVVTLDDWLWRLLFFVYSGRENDIMSCFSFLGKELFHSY